MRNTGYNAVRSTSISCPILCFLTGAHGPRGLLGPTWMMLWRRLLTWHSLPCAHRTWLLLWARPTHCTLSRTDLAQSGRLTCMRWAMSFRFITTVVGRTWPDMPNIYFSCSTTLNASSQSSDAVLLALPRKSRASPRRSAARPRRLVPCVSRSGTWRVAFMTRKRHFGALSVARLSATRSYFGTVSFYGRLRSPQRVRHVSLRSTRPRRTWRSRVCRRS
jgi:hypothetical protein